MLRRMTRAWRRFVIEQRLAQRALDRLPASERARIEAEWMHAIK